MGSTIKRTIGPVYGAGRSTTDLTDTAHAGNIREVDGEPWEVAQEAGTQLSVAYAEAQAALEDFTWAARGSWMSQEYHRLGRMPFPEDFEEAPLGRQINVLREQLSYGSARCAALTSAAGHDPRSH